MGGRVGEVFEGLVIVKAVDTDRAGGCEASVVDTWYGPVFCEPAKSLALMSV